MIWKLRKNFIRICSLSFLCVFILLFAVILIVNTVTTNNQLDSLTDIISENDGKFPPFEGGGPNGGFPERPGFNMETPFSTRFFTVHMDQNGSIAGVNLTSIASITNETAIEFASSALKSDSERGWIKDYRYKISDTPFGKSIVFVDGSMQRSVVSNFLLIAALVFVGGGLIVLLLVVFISKKAMKPAAESYEKQKQFITDVNHELKTPLTLILANLDIAEMELGKNEWLDDVRNKSLHMTDLVKRLVTLARMDEEQTEIVKQPFSISDTVSESTAYFQSMATGKGLVFTTEIEPDIVYNGDEGTIGQLISILLDNAFKYCDREGKITVKLCKKRYVYLTVENSYADINSSDLERLFDRFYRADQVRTSGEGFGIGLSIARSIVEKHSGTITAHNIQDKKIRFTVKL